MTQHNNYIDRIQEKKLTELFSHFPVLVVTGARQVGKSTVLSHLFPEPIRRVVFDPLEDIEGARRDPDLFLANNRTPIILDEIQYVPTLSGAIKRLLEKDRSPSQYILTGSQQWSMIKNLSDSLAGRAVFFDMNGLSLQEAARINTASPNAGSGSWLKRWISWDTREPMQHSSFPRMSLPHSPFEHIWRGWLPEAQFLPTHLIPSFHQSYQRTYIERDIRYMGEINDWSQFGRFIRLCAAMTGQEINHSQIGRDIGITPQTSARWLSLLKAAYQWYEIPAFSNNPTKRISQKPKGYLSDSGLVCYGLSLSSPTALSGHPSWGHIFEATIVDQVKKMGSVLDLAPTFYHWRSHGGAEVDLILELDGRFYPIEIKSKSHVSSGDCRGIAAFRETYPKLNIAPGLVIYLGETFQQITAYDYAMPWDAY